MASNASSNCLRVLYRFGGRDMLNQVKVGPNKYDAQGKLYDIFKIFASHYNICYTLTFNDNNVNMGDLNPINKTFDGNLGYLQRNEQDLFYFATHGTPERYEYFDFSSYTSIVERGTLMGYPKGKPNYAGFIKIFDSFNWIAVVCSLLLGFLVNIILMRATRKFTQQNNGLEQANKIFGVSFIIMFGSLMGQGVVNQRPKHLSTGLFISIWLLASLILNFIYKSRLLSVMVVPNVRLPFTNIFEMIDQNEVKWKLSRNSLLASEAEMSPPNSTLGKIYAKSIGFTKIEAEPNIFKEVQQGKLTIFLPDNIIPHAVNVLANQNDSCTFTKMKETFWSVPYFYMLRKDLNSTIKRYFNRFVTRLTESGIFVHLYYKNIRPSVFYCISTAGIPQRSLRVLVLEDFLGMFGLLLIGYSAAAIVFVLEYVTWKLKNKKGQELP